MTFERLRTGNLSDGVLRVRILAWTFWASPRILGTTSLADTFWGRAGWGRAGFFAGFFATETPFFVGCFVVFFFAIYRPSGSDSPRSYGRAVEWAP